MPEDLYEEARLNAFFAPDTVAVIGASTNPSKLRHAVLKNILDAG